MIGLLSVNYADPNEYTEISIDWTKNLPAEEKVSRDEYKYVTWAVQVNTKAEILKESILGTALMNCKARSGEYQYASNVST